MTEYRDFLTENFQIPEYEGPDKVCSLEEAIKKYIQPRMVIHLGQTGVRWCSAAIYQLAREFWGTKPDFTLVGVSMNHPVAVLVHGGLVKKLIASYCGDPYYAPSPNAVFQRAFQDNKVEFENWSILTLPLRLKAAAMGVKVMPTKSLMGSSMAQENRDSFRVIDDPFNPGERIGLVKALQPDITLIHGWAADRYGNAIFLPPYLENLYGAMASRRGTILTVEKIVSTDFIRQHAHLVKLPGRYVTSVSEVPFGSHPSGLSSCGLKEIEVYAEDYDFVEQACKTAKDPAKLQEWINYWVLSCNDHWDYLKKLGYERILYLKGKSRADAWRYNLEALPTSVDPQKYNSLEMAIIAAGRKIKEKMIKHKYQTILSGAGIANLASWLAFHGLKEEGYGVELMAEMGLYGYDPRPFDPALFNHANFPTCKVLNDLHLVMGILMAGSNNRCLGSLGTAEIDKWGNINTTIVGGKTFIVGSGGANDVASASREIVVTAVQSAKRFVDKVSYITSPGKRVTTLVSNLGIFEKLGDDQEFTLTGLLPNLPCSSLEEKVRYVKDHCGWELRVVPEPQEIAPPTQKELLLLRIFDPYRYFIGKPA
jgi:acyl CoA:acetate/3-ketoacid CoA transferase alpha subunit/acyl CoA:acetate/3-ketoacid CoA transferase beta subunit